MYYNILYGAACRCGEWFYGTGYILMGSNSATIFVLSFSIESVFPLRVNPISERLCCLGKETVGDTPIILSCAECLTYEINPFYDKWACPFIPYGLVHL